MKRILLGILGVCACHAYAQTFKEWQDPEINATQMAEKMNVSLRQMQRYLKQLSDLNLIARKGGRKNGIWKILDKDYDDFFERI